MQCVKYLLLQFLLNKSVLRLSVCQEGGNAAVQTESFSVGAWAFAVWGGVLDWEGQHPFRLLQVREPRLCFSKPPFLLLSSRASRELGQLNILALKFVPERNNSFFRTATAYLSLLWGLRRWSPLVWAPESLAPNILWFAFPAFSLIMGTVSRSLLKSLKLCWTGCMHAGSVAPVGSDSLWPRGLGPSRLLCPWDCPGRNTGVGCHALLQGIFPTQGSNLSPALAGGFFTTEPSSVSYNQKEGKKTWVIYWKTLYLKMQNSRDQMEIHPWGTTELQWDQFLANIPDFVTSKQKFFHSKMPRWKHI